MGWVMMTLRKQSLNTQINENQYKVLELSSRLRKLSNYSAAIADGKINTEEIASVGSGLFSDAIDFMGYSSDAAELTAQEKTDYYTSMVENIINKGGDASTIATQYGLYLDENGNLDEDATYQKFYEEAISEYAEEYISPALKELETDITNEKEQLETEIQSEEAELEQLDQSISNSIKQSAPQLS